MFDDHGREVLLQVSRTGMWVSSKVSDWFPFGKSPFPNVMATIQFTAGQPHVRRRGHFIMLEHGGSTVCLQTFGSPLLRSWCRGLHL